MGPKINLPSAGAASSRQAPWPLRGRAKNIFENSTGKLMQMVIRQQDQRVVPTILRYGEAGQRYLQKSDDQTDADMHSSAGSISYKTPRALETSR